MMKNKKIFAKIISCTMAAVLAVGTCSMPALAEENSTVKAETKTEAAESTAVQAEEDTSAKRSIPDKIIVINSEDDFKQFAEKCVNDEYSMHIQVILKKDLNLAGYDISPIPVFNGIFNGNGHRIKGFEYSDIGTNEGLFRYVSETGVVKNLNVEIVMTPDGDEKNIGGICGENRGTIENCNIMGTIKGLENVGGIAGVNEKTGIIRNCSNGAAVDGTKYTGGIAGYNYGLITDCANIGNIETIPCDDADGYGGIAGYSEGTIEKSVNRGNIGYKRTGYNGGGIAGVSKGDILNSQNEGEIYAKRNAGGIAGQNMPSSTTEYKNKLDEIGDILASMPDDFKAVNSEVDTLVDTVTDVMDEIDDTLSSVSDVIRDKGDKIADDLDVASDNVRDNSRDIEEAIDNMTVEGKLAVEGLQRVSNSLANVGDAIGKIQFEQMMQQISASSQAAGQALATISESMAQFGASNSQNMAQLAQLIALYFNYNAAGDGENAALVLSQIGAVAGQMSAGSGALKGQIEAAIQQLLKALKDMNDAIANVNEGIAKFKEALVIFNASIGRLNESYAALNAMADELNNVSNELDDAMDKINVFIDSATDDVKVIFDTSDDRIQLMDDNLSGMYDIIDGSTDRITDYLDNVADKMDSAVDLLQELFDGPEKITNDISENKETGLGSAIMGCTNSGAVSADYNAGGIAGIASKDRTRNLDQVSDRVTNLINGNESYKDTIEDIASDMGEDVDDETDIAKKVTDNLISDAFTVYRMHVSGCNNTGDVTVKNDYAGGIIGYGLEGAVIESSNFGLVTSEGEYCGGIMGYSEGVIRSCNSSGTLVSDGKAGGIAGYGYDIYDCNAMVAIESDSNTIGAIAYYAEGTVENNRFVSDVLAGVDGINRSGQATSVSYDEVKDIFDTMVVTFLGEDNEVLARMNVKYGASIDTLPAVMNKDKEYWVWDDFDNTKILTSMVIHGQYENRLSTLAANGERGQASFFAEGDFYPDQDLFVTQNTEAYGMFGDREVYYAADVSVSEHNNTPYKDDLTVRMKTSQEGVVYVLENGEYVKKDSFRDGSYVVFDVPNGGTFAYVEKQISPVTIILIVFAAAAVIGIIAGIVVVIRKKKARRAAAGTPAGTPADTATDTPADTAAITSDDSNGGKAAEDTDKNA